MWWIIPILLLAICAYDFLTGGDIFLAISKTATGKNSPLWLHTLYIVGLIAVFALLVIFWFSS